jgi:hypothetical protein
MKLMSDWAHVDTDAMLKWLTTFTVQKLWTRSLNWSRVPDILYKSTNLASIYIATELWTTKWDAENISVS